MNDHNDSSETDPLLDLDLQLQLLRYASDLNDLVEIQRAVRSLLKEIATGYLITDRQGGIIQADENAKTLLGLDDKRNSISDYIGASYRFELKVLLELMIKKSSDSSLPPVDDVVKWPCVIQGPDKKSHKMVAHIWALDLVNNRHLLVWILQDINRTRDAELEFKNKIALAVYRNIRDAITATDLDGNIVAVPLGSILR
jgi:PAS domain-containing protein